MLITRDNGHSIGQTRLDQVLLPMAIIWIFFECLLNRPVLDDCRPTELVFFFCFFQFCSLDKVTSRNQCCAVIWIYKELPVRGFFKNISASENNGEGFKLLGLFSIWGSRHHKGGRPSGGGRISGRKGRCLTPHFFSQKISGKRNFQNFKRPSWQHGMTTTQHGVEI